MWMEKVPGLYLECNLMSHASSIRACLQRVLLAHARLTLLEENTSQY